MCGRYVNVTKLQAVEKRFNVKAENPEDYQINANVTVGQKAPVILNTSPNTLSFYHFGLTPFWAKKKMYLFNARSEGDHNKENAVNYHGSMGIFQKPAFRKAIRSQRCLVIADAFIEGPQKEKLSKPYLVYRKEGDRPFALAGIYDEWIDKETGELYPSFSIITTQSHAITQKIGHHRSPVYLDKEGESLWLDESLNAADIASLLHPADGSEWNAYPLDPQIKRPGLNDLQLLQPIGERLEKEYSYELYEDLKLEGMGHTSARKRKLSE